MYRSALAVSLLAATALVPAHADSFAVNEYSASDLGRANSGRVTQTEDPAAAFGNPALLTRFEQAKASVVVSGILGNAEYEDQGSTDAIGNPLGGNTDGFLSSEALPAGHLVYPLNDKVALGLSVTVPFGLSTDYDADWPGRYQALTSRAERHASRSLILAPVRRTAPV